MLGFYDHPHSGTPIHPATRNPHPATSPVTSGKSARKHTQSLNALAARQWNELPYAMMRLTPARRQWDGKPFFWQDDIVQLGDIDLDLTKVVLGDRSPSFVAAFRINETRRAVTANPSPRAEQARREFRLRPSLEGEELRWNSPGVAGSINLTSDQLAERLLAKLAIFYTRGLSQS